MKASNKNWEQRIVFNIFLDLWQDCAVIVRAEDWWGCTFRGGYHGQSWRGFGPTDSWMRLLHCFAKWFMTFLGLKHVQLKQIIGCYHPLLRLMIIYIHVSWLFKSWIFDWYLIKKNTFSPWICCTNQIDFPDVFLARRSRWRAKDCSRPLGHPPATCGCKTPWVLG